MGDFLPLKELRQLLQLLREWGHMATRIRANELHHELYSEAGRMVHHGPSPRLSSGTRRACAIQGVADSPCTPDGIQAVKELSHGHLASLHAARTSRGNVWPPLDLLRRSPLCRSARQELLGREGLQNPVALSWKSSG